MSHARLASHALPGLVAGMVTTKSGEVGLSDSRHFPGSFPIIALPSGGLLCVVQHK